MKVRYCPNCHTERSIRETLCRGELEGGRCAWDLTSIPVSHSGQRPDLFVSTNNNTVSHLSMGCPNGHSVEPGDFLCPDCGEELVSLSDPLPSQNSEISNISGWQLERRLNAPDSVNERFRCEKNSQQAVLTLYQVGAEPDPSVIEVLQTMDLDHLPEIITTGRWSGRFYEVRELMATTEFDELELLPDNTDLLHTVVDELGRALHNFGLVSLCHRNLRPGCIFIRNATTLDLVIDGYSSARLYHLELETASLAETTLYTAPEALVGAVSAASDWWSLGVILLEKLSQGQCFEGLNKESFLIQTVARGLTLPKYLSDHVALLLKGLLTKDRVHRWQWTQVEKWLKGEFVEAPHFDSSLETLSQTSILLGTKQYKSITAYTLAAAASENWDEASAQLQSGKLLSWAKTSTVDSAHLDTVRELLKTPLPEQFYLSLALKALNRDLPLIYRGEIINPSWLLHHPLEAYKLMISEAPNILAELNADQWLIELKHRAERIRERATHSKIALNEELLKINLLSTSRAQLLAMWQEMILELPDSLHSGLSSVMNKREHNEEDLIVLLSAETHQYRSVSDILEEAYNYSIDTRLENYDQAEVERQLGLYTRRQLLDQVEQRTQKLARCGIAWIDGWVDQFRLERRMPIAQSLIVLAIPANHWIIPPKQEYTHQLIAFFEKKMSMSIRRGPLALMTVNSRSSRIDLTELSVDQTAHNKLMNRLLSRSGTENTLDPSFLKDHHRLVNRLRTLQQEAYLYLRDTGINGLYMGYPFLIFQPDGNVKPRIMPLLLWSISLDVPLGQHRLVTLSFDTSRNDVRVNPALESYLGPESFEKIKQQLNQLLRSTTTIEECLDTFSEWGECSNTEMTSLPKVQVGDIDTGSSIIANSMVLFHAKFMAQALIEDLRKMKQLPMTGEALEACLRIRDDKSQLESDVNHFSSLEESERFFVIESDPSQEQSIVRARQTPGLVIEGPPGTGKSQTIVNLIADAISRKKSLLLVCQKQAALEVVHKRLVAEGLHNLAIMIKDAQRDRQNVLTSVRNQLESLYAQEDTSSWQTKRTETASSIALFQKELNAYHQALHKVDSEYGISYRQLIGELITLESGDFPPIDAVATGAVVGPINLEQLADIEETCAPIARNWLKSHYEASALHVIKEFGWDKGQLAACLKSLKDYYAQEAIRSEHLEQSSEIFIFTDVTTIQTWLNKHLEQLNTTSDAIWLRFFPWFNRLRMDKDYSKDIRKKVLSELALLSDELSKLAIADHDVLAYATLLTLSSIQLATLARASQEATSTNIRYWNYFNPWYYRRKRQWTRFIHQFAQTDTIAATKKLQRAILLERALRTLRKRLLYAKQLLDQATPSTQDLSLDKLIDITSQLKQQLTETLPLIDLLTEVEILEHSEKLVQENSVLSVREWVNCIKESMQRAALQRQCTQALSQTAQWFTKAFQDNCQQRIAGHQDNANELKLVISEFDYLSDFQKFRVKASRYSEQVLTVFASLRTVDSELSKIPDNCLEEEVRILINRQARLAWKAKIEQKYPVLLLDRIDLEYKINKLRTLDKEIHDLNQLSLVNNIDPSTISRKRDWEAITRLRGPRAIRLREFFSRAVDMGLFTLVPVWLMGPDVASRVLPMRAGLFDIVVYDEASQIPVEYALPTLYRGKLAVVSGDDKQMPPTSFFSGKIDTEESGFNADEEEENKDSNTDNNEALDDWNHKEVISCPDLLLLARASLPSTVLQIHYRSAYRSLIEFSNAAFYASTLQIPVHHPDAMIQDTPPLEVVAVNGLYIDQTNPEEAKAIVRWLSKRWLNKKESPESIGVVTFNRKQSDLIIELLEQEAENSPHFRRAYNRECTRVQDEEDMGFFVKNVENVQGDERDIIIFSTTFGYNKEGQFRRNFGVLGQKGGERRLNVAITRARHKMVIFTSIPCHEVSDMLTTHRRPSSPRDYLQGYLEFCRLLSSGDIDSAQQLLYQISHQAAQQKTITAHYTDGFKESVGKFIRNLGLQVISVEDNTAFSLDWAIADPATGLFAIAIECDAPQHRILKDARAREVWRPQVLSLSIQHIYRVSSHGWYHHSTEEKLGLSNAIQHALNYKLTLDNAKPVLTGAIDERT